MSESYEEDISDNSSYSTDDSMLSDTEKSIECRNTSILSLEDYTEEDAPIQIFTRNPNSNKFLTSLCFTHDELINHIKSSIISNVMCIYSPGGNLTGMGSKPTKKIVVKLPVNNIYITYKSFMRLLKKDSESGKYYAIPLFNGKRRRIGNLKGLYGISMNHGQIPGFLVYKLYTKNEIKYGIYVKEDNDEYLEDLDASSGQIDNIHIDNIVYNIRENIGDIGVNLSDDDEDDSFNSDDDESDSEDDSFEPDNEPDDDEPDDDETDETDSEDDSFETDDETDSEDDESESEPSITIDLWNSLPDVDSEGYRRGFNFEGYDREGYNKRGFNKDGINRQGYNKDGFSLSGYDRHGNTINDHRGNIGEDGYDKLGYDKYGYHKDGFNKYGFDIYGYGPDGFDEEGLDKNDINRYGFKRLYASDINFVKGIDNYKYILNNRKYGQLPRADKYVNGYNVLGFNREGYNIHGYDKYGYDKDGYNRYNVNDDGYDRDGNIVDSSEYEDNIGFFKDGYSQDGFNRNGYDIDGYNRYGVNIDNINRFGVAVN